MYLEQTLLILTLIHSLFAIDGVSTIDSHKYDSKIIPNFEYYVREKGSLVPIDRSSFSAKKPNSSVIFYIHGWKAKNLDDGEDGSESRLMKDAFFEKRPEVDYVILVDWTKWSDTVNYPKAISTYAPQVAASLSTEIDNLLNSFGIRSSDVELIGHSLGAHIAGQAGRDLKSKGKEIGSIIALDPARTSISSSDEKSNNLRPDDASKVLSLHTDDILGIYANIGIPEQNIFVKSGKAFDKCSGRSAYGKHKCQHRSSKPTLIEAFEHPGSLHDPKKYEHFTHSKNSSVVMILVLDVSPSMKDNGRLHSLITSSKRFIKSAPLNTYVGIVIFGGNAQASQSPLRIESDTERNTLLAKLPNIYTQIGATSIGAGLEAALAMSQPFISSGSCPEFILVTDGEENAPPTLDQVRPKLQKTCVTVNSNALGGSADKGLEMLSSSTNGQVAAASDSNSLDKLSQSLMDAAYDQLPSNARPIQLPPKMATLDGPSKTFLIDTGVGKNTKFFISAPSAFQTTIATLTDPKGQNTVSDASYVDQDSKGLVFNVPNAQPGEWSVKLNSKPTNGRKKRSTGTEATIFVSTMAIDDNPVRLETELSSNLVNYSTRSPVAIRAQLRKGDDEVVVGAQVVAYILSPDGEKLNVTLLDNGFGADKTKDDGIYSKFMTSSLSLDSRYEVSVVATSGDSARIRNMRDDPYAIIEAKDLDLKVVYPFERHTNAGSLRAIDNYTPPLPSPVQDLAVRRLSQAEAKELNDEASPNQIYCELVWTAAAANGDIGTVTGFEIQGTTNLYTKMDSGTLFIFNTTQVRSGSFQPLSPGELQKVVLEIPEQIVDEVKLYANETGNPLQLYLTLRSFNNNSEFSEVSNIATVWLDKIEVAGNDHFLVRFAVILFICLFFAGVIIIFFFYVCRMRHVYATVPQPK